MDKNQLLVPASIVLAGFIVAGAVYYSRVATPGVAVPNRPAAEKVSLDPVVAEDHILGSPNAELIIVEYSDTECPFCKSFHATMHQIVDEYGKVEKVAWVYRHFPITQLHSKAYKEAEATECAAELGGKSKFWDYIDQVFKRTNSNDSLDPAELPKIAKDLGLNTASFNECLGSGRTKTLVDANYASGERAGVQGTPHSIILTKDGETFPLEGALPYSSVKGVIESLLKGN